MFYYKVSSTKIIFFIYLSNVGKIILVLFSKKKFGKSRETISITLISDKPATSGQEFLPALQFDNRDKNMEPNNACHIWILIL